MGFPVPMTEWMKAGLKDYLWDVYKVGAKRGDEFINYQQVLAEFEGSEQFSRKLWGFLCFEVWQQQFHDRAAYFKNLI